MAEIENITKHNYKGDEVRNEKLTAKATEIMGRYHNPDTNQDAVKDMINLLDAYIWKAVKAYNGVDEEEDLYSACVIAIMEDMKEYNPKVASPIKYFKTHSIVRALQARTLAKENISSHYHGVIKQIKKLEKQYGEENVKKWTNERIADLTGYSPKTIQAAQEQRQIKIVGMDAAEGVSDEYFRNPEHIFLSNELSNTLADALKKLDVVNRRIFLQVAMQDSINWAEVKRTLEEDSAFMEELGRANLSISYIQTHYKIARHSLNMNRKIQELRPNYDFSEEVQEEDDYEILEIQLVDLDTTNLIEL